ncbi:MAG: YfiR family protein [Candidatus Omnitrophota bacterium]
MAILTWIHSCPIRNLLPPIAGNRGSQAVCFVLFAAVTLFSPLAIVWGSVFAQQESNSSSTYKEYDVKAAYLYNFLLFVEWPSQSFEKPESPFVIGVLGKDPFNQKLDDIAERKTARKRKIIIKRFKKWEDLEPCHLLFVCQEEGKNWEKISDKIKDWKVLTVGDYDNFAILGGIVQFIRVEDTVRFVINEDAALLKDLEISAKMLELAVRVIHQESQEGKK